VLLAGPRDKIPRRVSRNNLKIEARKLVETGGSRQVGSKRRSRFSARVYEVQIRNKMAFKIAANSKFEKKISADWRKKMVAVFRLV